MRVNPVIYLLFNLINFLKITKIYKDICWRLPNNGCTLTTKRCNVKVQIKKKKEDKLQIPFHFYIKVWILNGCMLNLIFFFLWNIRRLFFFFFLQTYSYCRFLGNQEKTKSKNQEESQRGFSNAIFFDMRYALTHAHLNFKIIFKNLNLQSRHESMTEGTLYFCILLNKKKLYTQIF